MKVQLSDTSKAQYVGRRLTCDVYVSGKSATPYIIPREVYFRCPAGPCRQGLCRLIEAREASLLVDASSRNILSLLGKSDNSIVRHLRSWMGACDVCSVSVVSRQTVEELRVSPHVDVFLPSSEYVTRECYYLGHGLKTNRPYEIECFCYPDPETQRAVLVADKAKPLRDMIETYRFDPNSGLEIFRKPPEELFDKLYEDFAANVHRIVGRRDMQIAFDLSFHSVLSFRFQGVELRRGWVESFILGDSGQGKTEMSLCLLNHYGLGDRVQGEGSSSVGLIGGLEKLGERWILVWGRIPQMDRRLLIIDEFSGLSEESISRLSDIRTTGIAEITKIRTERASARTRLVMMSNTRDGRPLSMYNTGVEALKTVFTHSEDIRRLDFAICVASGELAPEVFNQRVKAPHIFTSSLCRNLILWAWSRAPEQVLIPEHVENLILERASRLSSAYSSFIPLVEPADIRIKLARLAVACACRCFSSDSEGNVVVLPEHVEFVYNFLKRCYDSPYMAYNEYSRRARVESEFADGELEAAIAEFVKFPQWREATVILQSIGNPFRGYEVAEQLGLDVLDVRELVRFLARYRMIETLPAGYRKQVKLNVFLRSLQKSLLDKEAHV